MDDNVNGICYERITTVRWDLSVFTCLQILIISMAVTPECFSTKYTSSKPVASYPCLDIRGGTFVVHL